MAFNPLHVDFYLHIFFFNTFHFVEKQQTVLTVDRWQDYYLPQGSQTPDEFKPKGPVPLCIYLM
jgi:hypothetical protein